MLKSILAACAAAVVFQMPANAATDHVIYAFKNGSDGALPISQLIAVGGVFYGTTEAGGPAHAGVVFGVTAKGVEHVVYAFNGGNDGETPRAGLINVGGLLYGTTAYGGGTGCGGAGCGTVFSVTPGGVEKIVYAFKGGDDGYQPGATLLHVGSRLTAPRRTAEEPAAAAQAAARFSGSRRRALKKSSMRLPAAATATNPKMRA